MRPFKLQKTYLPHAEGSCLVSMGETKVLCVSTVENDVPKHAEEKGIGWVHAEYSMLPRAGEQRSSRARASSGGRAQEISRLIGRSLRAAVSLEKLGARSLLIDCDVIRADGGTRTASVNGGLVALVESLLWLKSQDQLQQWPLKEFVGAISVGYVKGRPVVDMAYEDDKNAETDLNVVMTESGKFIEVQATAEGAPFSQRQLTQMLSLAEDSIQKIIQQQKKLFGRLPK